MIKVTLLLLSNIYDIAIHFNKKQKMNKESKEVSGLSITTFLLNEKDPIGVKYAEIDEQVLRCWFIPRKLLRELAEKEELKKGCLYFLLGENKEGEKKVYVGETSSFYNRRVSESKDDKDGDDWWDKALVFINTSRSFQPTETRYLEYLAIKKLKEDKSFFLDNTQNPREINLEEHQRVTLQRYFDSIQFFCFFFNYSIFEDITNIKDKAKGEKKIFLLKQAQGIYTSDKFIVLKGSKISSVTETEKVIKYFPKIKRQREDVLNKNSNGLLKENITFRTPSSASIFCLGRHSNGWDEWKNKDGKTLDEIYRQPLNNKK